VGLGRPIADLQADSADYLRPADLDPVSSHMFSYFVRAARPDPGVTEVSAGFDQLLLVTPEPSSLRGLRIGRVTVEERPVVTDPTQSVTAAVGTRFTDYYERAPGDSLFRNAAGVALTILPSGPDSLWVQLPSSVNRVASSRSHALVEFQFESRTYTQNAVFEAFIRSSGDPSAIFQRVESESCDATELVDASTSAARLVDVSGVITGVELNSVITPNGDGINDALEVRFVLLKVSAERPLEVAIHDLQGRLVARGLPVGTAEAVAGEVTFTWDGVGENGQVVPPGVYLCRIAADTDAGSKNVTRVIHVAY
jgi:hypothetical protein